MLIGDFPFGLSGGQVQDNAEPRGIQENPPEPCSFETSSARARHFCDYSSRGRMAYDRRSSVMTCFRRRICARSNPKLQDPGSNHSQTPNPKSNPQTASRKTAPARGWARGLALGVGISVWALGVGSGWDLELGAWDLTRQAPSDPPPRPDLVRQPYSDADVDFMAGMIPHHAQAVLIAGWAASHGARPDIRILCERIVVGQRDEIATMRTWLRDRGQTVPAPDATHHRMKMNGVEHDMLMPGMLTPEDLAR